MEERGSPFFEQMLINYPNSTTFAYIVATAHASIIRGPFQTIDGQPVQKVPVPKRVTILKKNVSICGFASPLDFSIKRSADDYMRDLLENGIEHCHPNKIDMEEYLKEVQADPNVQIMVDSLLKKIHCYLYQRQLPNRLTIVWLQLDIKMMRNM